MNENKNSIYFPLLLNIKNYPCLVVGGGKVALRKVTSLLNFRIKVTVLAPKLCEPLLELQRKRKIKVIKKVYSKEYLNNFKIVFCATDNPKINKMVRKDCTEKNILLNVADIPELCDFILPAIVKRGDLTISVSSQGKAPFYAKYFKSKLESGISISEAEVMNLAEEYRILVFSDADINSLAARRKAFKEFVSLNWEKIIEENGMEGARDIMRELLENQK